MSLIVRLAYPSGEAARRLLHDSFIERWRQVTPGRRVQAAQLVDGSKRLVKEVMTMRNRSSLLLLTLAAGIAGVAVRPSPAAAAKSNAEVAFNFFRQRGFSKAQAAGIVGNLVQESNVNPKSSQAGGPGRGIAQWSSPGRWDSLVGYARARHTSPWALNTQLWFIWHEFTASPGYGLKELRAAKTVAAATRVFEKKFEICGECDEPRRVAEAQTTLRNYGA